MSDLSAATPPPGVTPNFDDPASSYVSWMAVNIVLLAIVVASVAVRVVTKAIAVKRWFIEDTFSVISMCLFAVWTGIGVQTRFAETLTRHQWDVRKEDMTFIKYWCYVLGDLFPVAMLLAKLSVLFQIKRIFTTGHRNGLWWIIMSTIALTSLFYVAATLIFTFHCNPTAKSWNPKLIGNCMNLITLEVAIAVINVASDFMILAIPMVAIWRLNAKRKRQLELSCIFGVGFFACVLGTTGLAFRTTLYDTNDSLHALTLIHLFCYAENATVILVGCIPSFPKLYYHFKRGRNASSLGSGPVFEGSPSGSKSTSDKPGNSTHDSEGRQKVNPLSSMAKYLRPEDLKNGDNLETKNEMVHVEEVAEDYDSRKLESPLSSHPV